MGGWRTRALTWANGQGISDDKLVKWAKDADYVILKAGNCQANTIPSGTTCDEWWTDKLEKKLKGIKGVDAKKVWDTYRLQDPNGGSASMEYAELEPDVMMQVRLLHHFLLQWRCHHSAIPSFC